MKDYAPGVMHHAAAVTGYMRRRGSATTLELAEVGDTSVQTTRRALAFLRECGCPLTFSRSALVWVLADRSWSLPLFELRPAGWVPTDKAVVP